VALSASWAALAIGEHLYIDQQPSLLACDRYL
jgi:hypothetical protein